MSALDLAERARAHAGAAAPLSRHSYPRRGAAYEAGRALICFATNEACRAHMAVIPWIAR
eukprot:8286515-Alexandrium_andersonii.AAC.1